MCASTHGPIQLAAIGVTDFVAGEFATGEDAARTRALLRDLATGSR